MRITQNMMKFMLVNDVDNVLKRLATLHQQASTGKKFEFPSQNPSGAFLASNYDSTLRQINSYQSSLAQIQGRLKGYDSIISQLTSAVQRIQSLVVQASNGTNTPADRKAIGDEVKTIRDLIVQLGNTKVGDSYIFSGPKNTTPILSNTLSGSAPYFYVSNSSTSIQNTLKVGTFNITTNFTLPDIFGYSGTVANSLIAYKSYGGTTNVTETLTGGARSFNGAIKLDLKSGDVTLNSGVLNETVGTSTTVKINGATSVVVTTPGGTIVTSGSATYDLRAGDSISVTDGTVNLSASASTGASNSLNITSGNVEISNASGSTISFVTTNKSSDSSVNLGLLDKIINDLNTNNVQALRTDDLGDLEKYENSLQRVTAYVGSREQMVQSLNESTRNFGTYITELLSKTQDADMVKVISDISMQQTVFQAALESSAKALLPTLADFLR